MMALFNSDEAEDTDDGVVVVDPEAEIVKTQVMLGLFLEVYTTGGQNSPRYPFQL